MESKRFSPAMDSWLGCKSQTDEQAIIDSDTRLHKSLQNPSQQYYNQTTRFSNLSGCAVQAEVFDQDLHELCELILSGDDYSSNDWNNHNNDECILFVDLKNKSSENSQNLNSGDCVSPSIHSCGSLDSPFFLMNGNNGFCFDVPCRYN